MDHFSAVQRDKFKDDSQVVRGATGPATIQIPLELMRAQPRIERVELEKQQAISDGGRKLWSLFRGTLSARMNAAE
jgi:hypothetical protein